MPASAPGDRAPGGEGLPRGSRIRLGGEIRTLLGAGTRLRGSWLELFTAPSPTGTPRYGTVVPRYGKTVVERNLLRRRLREIGRREIIPGLRARGCASDVLVRARPPAYAAAFTDLRTELTRLTDRLCSDAS